MSAQRSVTPIKHPFLMQLDELRRVVNEQIDLLRDQFHRLEDDTDRLIGTAAGRNDDMSTREVAEYVGVSPSALRDGLADTDCLRLGRIQNGRNYSYLRWRVELHRRNQLERGSCGDCDKAQKPNLLQIR